MKHRRGGEGMGILPASAPRSAQHHHSTLHNVAFLPVRRFSLETSPLARCDCDCGISPVETTSGKVREARMALPPRSLQGGARGSVCAARMDGRRSSNTGSSLRLPAVSGFPSIQRPTPGDMPHHPSHHIPPSHHPQRDAVAPPSLDFDRQPALFAPRSDDATPMQQIVQHHRPHRGCKSPGFFFFLPVPPPRLSRGRGRLCRRGQRFWVGRRM